MSRTYRRKNRPIPRWVTQERFRIFRIENSYRFAHFMYVQIEPQTDKYAKLIAKYRSDAGTHNSREPGPSWFRNLYTERPQRREAKRQLQKFKQDPTFEVMLNKKDPLEYWT